VALTGDEIRARLSAPAGVEAGGGGVRAWARAESSTLRIDLRYTPTSCFETYPWPAATPAGREAIGAIAAELVARRAAVCSTEDIGLTALYNAVDDGAYADVADLHRRLDGAVCEAYGWTAALAADPLELRARLAALNEEITGEERAYDPFADDGPRA